MDHEQPEHVTLQHTAKAKARLLKLTEYLRDDASRLTEPQARALFDYSVQLLDNLMGTIVAFEQKIEAEWQAPGKAEQGEPWPRQDGPLT